LTEQPPRLANFSAFHPRFRGSADGETPEGDIRDAFFLAYQDGLCEYLTSGQARQQTAQGRELVSATFVIPYPPGFPYWCPAR
jgi:arginine decarboxylase